MLAKTHSVALIGADAYLVTVEVDVGQGMPGFRIVGLPTASVREAEQRTHSAIEAAQEKWPRQRVTANLAPGALRKEGTHFDLALALGVLAGQRRLDAQLLDEWVCIGELALDGTVRPTRGALAAAIACREGECRGLICSRANASEAALVEGVEVIAVESLRECIDFFKGESVPAPVTPYAPVPAPPIPDLSTVRGQPFAKVAVEVAAAGSHNLLLKGPPGSGKTMLAQRLPGIFPPMTFEESLDVTKVHSVAGLLDSNASLITERPFRAPHHHISLAGLVGGGSGLARPGEISLAHHGTLFLDELSLYRRDVLESLRGPLEDGVVRIARSGGVIAFPCKISLVAAMNPCPCGYLEDTDTDCTCNEHQLHLYLSRLSGPLLDRMDLQAVMPRLTSDELLGPPDGETSPEVRERVIAARRMQTERYGDPALTNASIPRKILERHVTINRASRAALIHAIEQRSLSGRGLDRVLRVARTLADLEQRDDVDESHIVHALSLRLQPTQEMVS
jgi:magnesium chelatase family protein